MFVGHLAVALAAKRAAPAVNLGWLMAGVTALDLVWLEYDKLCREGISQRELDDTRDQLKGSMLLGMEGAASKMSRMAKNEMYYGRQIGVQEVVERLDAITRDDVMRMANAYYGRDRNFVVGLGPLAGV